MGRAAGAAPRPHPQLLLVKVLMDQAAQRKWDEWAREHRDLLLSVERGPDADQTRRIADDLAEKLELCPEDRLLDVGCGSGLLLSLLRERSGAEVMGVDFAPSQLRLGRTHFPDIAFAAASAEAVPFAEGAFTKLLCYGVWHYVESWRETLDQFLGREGRRGGRPGKPASPRRHRERVHGGGATRGARLLNRPRPPPYNPTNTPTLTRARRVSAPPAQP